MVAREKNPERFEPFYQKLGARLRWIRQQKGLTTSAVGIRLKYTAGTIAMWEVGKSRIKLTDLMKLAIHVYEVPVDKFINTVIAKFDPSDLDQPAAVVAERKVAASKRVATMARQKSQRKREK